MAGLVSAEGAAVRRQVAHRQRVAQTPAAERRARWEQYVCTRRGPCQYPLRGSPPWLRPSLCHTTTFQSQQRLDTAWYLSKGGASACGRAAHARAAESAPGYSCNTR